MKKFVHRIFFLSLAFLVVISITVYAHPGRTDGSGGHTDNSTGEYHYHHGYSEHQHYDMDDDGIADCPYDYNYKKNTAKVEKDREPSNTNSSFADEYNDLKEQQQESEVDDDVSTDKSNNDTAQHYSEKQKANSKITLVDIIEAIFAAFVFFGAVLYALAFLFRLVELAAKKFAKKEIDFSNRFIRGLLVVSALIGAAISIFRLFS